MKTTILILTFILSQLGMAEDMQKYMRKTNDLAKEGKHEEALKRHVWFHNHALEHQPSMYGVRLSFALNYWKQLADKYPPALKAMKEIRDAKTKSFEQGKGERDTFFDVEALNRTLGEDLKSITLFESIANRDPDLADQCWRSVKDTVIKEKRYDLAQKYIQDLSGEFDQLERRYLENVKMYDRQQGGGKHFKKYNENRLVKDALQLIDFALATDKRDEAVSVQKRALALVKDDRLSKAVDSTESVSPPEDACCFFSFAGKPKPTSVSIKGDHLFMSMKIKKLDGFKAKSIDAYHQGLGEGRTYQIQINLAASPAEGVIPMVKIGEDVLLGNVTVSQPTDSRFASSVSIESDDPEVVKKWVELLRVHFNLPKNRVGIHLTPDPVEDPKEK